MNSKNTISNNSSTIEDDKTENEIFVSLLKKRKIIFQKEHTPQIQKKKKLAIESLRIEFNESIGDNLTFKQIRKKLNNLKCRVREAVRKRNTGKRNTELKHWEKTLLKLWNTGDDDDNQDIDSKQISGDLDDICTTATGEISEASEGDQSVEVAIEISNAEAEEDDDDDAYKNLSIDDLCRLRLIAQIKAAKAQEKAAIAQEKASKAATELSTLKKYLLLQKNDLSATSHLYSET